MHCITEDKVSKAIAAHIRKMGAASQFQVHEVENNLVRVNCGGGNWSVWDLSSRRIRYVDSGLGHYHHLK